MTKPTDADVERARMLEGRLTWILTSRINVLASELAAVRRETLERAAKLADAHKGSAGKTRRDRGQIFRDLPNDAVQEIQAEERGEDIAAEIIAHAIRALIEGDTT